MTPGPGDDTPLFFDLDGTLVDSAAGIIVSLQHALTVSGIPAPDIDWRRFIGPPLPKMISAALPHLDPGQHDAVITAYRKHYASTGLFKTVAFPGVVVLLQRLRNDGRTIYVVTNKPQGPAEAIVLHLGLDPFVYRIVGGDPAGHDTKPDRAAALAEEEGIGGGIFVGDGIDDLHAAERIGARFLLASWGYGSASVLATRPDVTPIQRPIDVIDHLGPLRPGGECS